MRWFLSALITLVAGSSCAQEFVHPLAHEVDKNNYIYFLNRDGKVMPSSLSFYKKRVAQRKRSSQPFEVKEYFGNGQFALHTFVENPDPIFSRYQKSYLSFYANGDTCKWIEYRKTRRHGAYRTFHENGTLRETCRYKKGRREGRFLRYNASGHKQETGTFENGDRAGQWVSYHSNGDTASVVNYIAGDRYGSQLKFYPDGQLKSLRFYEQDLLEDTSVVYHQNGNVSSVGTYRNGKPVGVWKSYSEDGELIAEKNYKEGNLDGAYFEATSWGDTLAYGTVKEGRFFGFETAYTADRELFYRSEVKSGTQASIWYYDSDGNIIRKGKMTDAGMLYTCPLPGEEGATCEFSTETPPNYNGNLMEQIGQGTAVSEIADYRPRGVYGFSVDNKGNTVNSYVIESANHDYDAIVLKTLELLTWEAGASFEHNAKFSNELAIRFVGFDNHIKFGRFYRSDTLLDRFYRVPKFLSSLSDKTSPPKYPGGDEALYDYLASETKYPENAKDAGARGTAIIGFVVEKSGIVSRPEVIIGQFPSFEYEAIRVVENMPLWIAGVKDGKEVPVYYSLPFRFTLK